MTGRPATLAASACCPEDLRQLMVDWRAPEAGTFYQATAFERMGVRRRRHLLLQGRNVKAIEDDVLDHTMLVDGEHLQGEGALLAALNSKRTGRMNDIVGTIQSEQDRIIRSPLQRRPRGSGRARHRQDRRGPAPRRLPALHAPRTAASPPACCWWARPTPS